MQFLPFWNFKPANRFSNTVGITLLPTMLTSETGCNCNDCLQEMLTRLFTFNLWKSIWKDGFWEGVKLTKWKHTIPIAHLSCISWTANYNSYFMLPACNLDWLIENQNSQWKFFCFHNFEEAVLHEEVIMLRSHTSLKISP